MSDIRSILILPADAHREALLGDGPCGARVPRAIFLCCLYGHEEYGVWRLAPGEPARSCQSPEHPDGRLPPLLIGAHVSALVLACDGRVVPEGCLRAMRAGDVTGYESLVWWWSPAPLDKVAKFADACEEAGLGHALLLDGDGREVTP